MPRDDENGHTQAKGRPIWADTEQSMQTIDMGKSLLSNTAVYQVRYWKDGHAYVYR